MQRPLERIRLEPGDSINVTVQRFPDLSFAAQINTEGNIVVPLLGTIPLRGLTIEQARQTIRSSLNRFVFDPIVTVVLSGQRPDLSFAAQINSEGNIVVPRVGVLSLEGLTLDEAQEKIRLSLDRIAVDPIVTLSLTGPRPVQVTIIGEVVRPGIYGLGGTGRVSDALVAAGGSNATADLRAVQVRRTLIDGSVIEQKIDLFTPLQNGGTVPSLRLQDGDALIVPKREIGNDEGYDRVLVSRSTLAQQQINIRVLSYVNGAVGNVTLPNGSTFIDALTAISPNPENTRFRQIALIRFDPEQGKAITRKFDAKAALRGDATQDIPLQDNDVIIVGRNLIGRITSSLNRITRPFRDIFGFLFFFDNF